jgi:hypothetical protein
MESRPPEIYPAIHRLVVELILLALLLHGAFKFLSWLWQDVK